MNSQVVENCRIIRYSVLEEKQCALENIQGTIISFGGDFVSTAHFP